MISQVLAELRATTSKKEKEAILKKHNSPGIRQFFYDVYNPQYNYFIKKMPEPYVCGRDIMPYGAVVPEVLHALRTRSVTGHAASDRLARVLGRLFPEDRELVRLVLAGDAEAGINISTLNRAYGKNFIFEPPYQRCETESNAKFEKWDWTKHHYLQLKADGMFVNVIKNNEGIDFMTRGGNVFPRGVLSNLCWHVSDCLPLDYVTHGELVVFQDGKALPRTISNGILNSALHGEIPAPQYEVRLFVWDCVTLKEWAEGESATSYKERLQRLNRNLHIGGPVALIETRLIHSVDEAKEIALQWMKEGYEGAIVKNADGVWKDHTSPNQVKLKVQKDVTLKVIGFNLGSGKNKDLFGSLRCTSEDGRLIVDVGGFTDKQRKEINNKKDYYLGKCLDVLANCVLDKEGSDVKSLFLPRFIEWRLDRVTADTLPRVLEVFSSDYSC